MAFRARSVRNGESIVNYLLIIFAAMFVACEPVPPPKPTPKRETPFSRCVDTGGIPVTSAWDGRLTNCIFPPQEAR